MAVAGQFGARIEGVAHRVEPALDAVAGSGHRLARLVHAILDVVGPLGKPSEIDRYGTVIVVGGGVGTAIALPTARAMREAGNRVFSILGARTKDLLILEDEVRAVSDQTFIMTDDGSYGQKGLVTDKLRQLIQLPIGFVLAIGPVPMMRAVADVTRERGIRTMVSLNSIMVDGTGMCGGCRVVVGGKSEFACVDGPEFDAHGVDYDAFAEVFVKSAAGQPIRIIANRPVARERENRNVERTGLGIVRAMVSAYGECHPKLRKHDPRFPSKEELFRKTVAGD